MNRSTFQTDMSAILLSLLLLCLLLATITPLTACTKAANPLSIKPEILEYSPFMSSTPGIPLEANLTRDLKNKNYVYHWSTEEGTFLKWHNISVGKGRVETLGNDIKTNEHKVFWSVDPNHEIEAKAFQVLLTIEALDTGNVVYETSLEIKQDKPGYFEIEE